MLKFSAWTVASSSSSSSSSLSSPDVCMLRRDTAGDIVWRTPQTSRVVGALLHGRRIWRGGQFVRIDWFGGRRAHLLLVEPVTTDNGDIVVDAATARFVHDADAPYVLRANLATMRRVGDDEDDGNARAGLRARVLERVVGLDDLCTTLIDAVLGRSSPPAFFLLYGATGTGKSHLVHTIARESGRFVGRVRSVDLIRQRAHTSVAYAWLDAICARVGQEARRAPPSVLVLDDLDRSLAGCGAGDVVVRRLAWWLDCWRDDRRHVVVVATCTRPTDVPAALLAGGDDDVDASAAPAKPRLQVLGDLARVDTLAVVRHCVAQSGLSFSVEAVDRAAAAAGDDGNGGDDDGDNDGAVDGDDDDGFVVRRLGRRFCRGWPFVRIRQLMREIVARCDGQDRDRGLVVAPYGLVLDCARGLQGRLLADGDVVVGASQDEGPVRTAQRGGVRRPLASVLAGISAEVERELSILFWPSRQLQDGMRRLRVKRPRGALIFGPKGVGKTTLVQWVAETTQQRVIFVHSSELVSSIVGESCQNIQRLFQRARRQRPCVLVVDCLEVLAPRRGSAGDSTEQTYDRMLSTLLTELDGLKTRRFKLLDDDDAVDADAAADANVDNDEDADDGVTFLATTSVPEVLDPAIMRPGRLDYHLELEMPGADARAAILALYTSAMRVAPDVDAAALQWLARLTPGYSGADLRGLCREAGMRCLSESMTAGGGGEDDIVRLRHLDAALRLTAPQAMARVGTAIQRDSNVSSPFQARKYD